jgi:hypothetical protein
MNAPKPSIGHRRITAHQTRGEAMYRSLKNTAAVLFATALTALAIFGGVQLASFSLGGADSGSASTSNIVQASNVSGNAVSQASTLTCPRTGCTASTCHAVTGLPPGQ